MAEVPSHMRGATNEPVRDNPTVRSKFDKSHGKGLPAPHIANRGPIMGTTNPAPRVFQAPKNVGSPGTIRLEHIAPSQLGSGMAEGRHYAKSPNMAQTQVQGSSSAVGTTGTYLAPQGNAEQPSNRDPLRTANQRPTRSESPASGGGPNKRNAGTQVYGGERVSRGSTKQGPGVLHANKRGSGPNLK